MPAALFIYVVFCAANDTNFACVMLLRNDVRVFESIIFVYSVTYNDFIFVMMHLSGGW